MVAHSEKSISLYEIEESLAELLSARDEVTADLRYMEVNTIDPQDYADKQKESVEVERLLVEYGERAVLKVDGWHSAIRRMETDLVAEKEEKAAISARISRTEGTLKRLKAIGVEIMRKFDKKALVGTAGRKLSRCGNGGIQPLDIQGWDAENEKWCYPYPILPAEFQDVVVRMPLDMYFACGMDSRCTEISRQPANGRIREALAQPCPTCGGTAQGLHCDDCNDTGKASVPGASLAIRGEHLRLS